jgi:hypothetical protein
MLLRIRKCRTGFGTGVAALVRRFLPTIFSHMLAASLTFCIYGHKVLAEPHTILPRVAKAAPAYRSAKDRPGPRTPVLGCAMSYVATLRRSYEKRHAVYR